MVVTWLIVALVSWPLIALAIGVFLGRGMAGNTSRMQRRGPAQWLRRELPRDIVAPLPVDQDLGRI